MQISTGERYEEIPELCRKWHQNYKSKNAARNHRPGSLPGFLVDADEMARPRRRLRLPGPESAHTAGDPFRATTRRRKNKTALPADIIGPAGHLPQRQPARPGEPDGRLRRRWTASQ